MLELAGCHANCTAPPFFGRYVEVRALTVLTASAGRSKLLPGLQVLSTCGGLPEALMHAAWLKCLMPYQPGPVRLALHRAEARSAVTHLWMVQARSPPAQLALLPSSPASASACRSPGRPPQPGQSRPLGTASVTLCPQEGTPHQAGSPPSAGPLP